MKNIFKSLQLMRIFVLILLAGFISTRAAGQETIFHECVPTFTAIPAGWQSNDGGGLAIFQTATGGYLLADHIDDWVITSPYDLSNYQDVVLTIAVATYGSGTTNPLTIDVSNDGGATWTHQSFVTATPTSATYINGGDFNITADGTQVKFRFWRNASSGRGVRFRNIQLVGVPAGSSTSAATPEFDPPAGTYFSGQYVEITTTTEGATIYYTLNGDDPDNTSTEYTAPIAIGATTTVKAIAYAPDFNPSAIAEAAYTFPAITEVANLAELRDAYSAKVDYFKVLGEVVVTFKQPFRNQLFIQDATAAILIDDLPGKITTNYAVGDGITGIVGSFTYFGNMLQFNPAADPGDPTSSGILIVPELITIDQLLNDFEEFESELVRIEGVTFADGGALFANGQVYAISDDSKANGLFRTTFFDVDYIGTPIPSSICNLVGIPNARVDGFYFTSRSLSDIELPPTITVLSPNGGEQIEQGTVFEIEWFTANFDGDVEVILHTPIDKGGTLLGTVSGTFNTFEWDVAQDVGEYVIIVKANGQEEPWDMSDATFNIVPPIDIKITEIMYNPPEAGADTLEFIEFYNNGLGIVNMLNWTISKGVVYTFPDIDLNPGDYLVVCVKASAFFNTFGFDALQWSSGGLSNGGEAVELSDNFGNVRAYVLYDDNSPWPTEPNGRGPSLEFCNPDLENNDPANWTFSTKLAAINANGQGIYCTPGFGCNQNQTLSLTIPAGWSGFSSNLIPGRISMNDLFAPTYHSLVIMLSKNGILWPGQNINSIGEWDTYTGYKAKFNTATFFVFEGTEPYDKSLTLLPGTHLIPVLSQDAVDVTDLIVPLGNAVEFMFDIADGLIYWPAGGITPGVSAQSLNTLFPGIAYLIKVNTETTIDFGSDLPKSNSVYEAPALVNATTWNNVVSTGSQHIISISKSALQTFESGDFVRVFNQQGLCAGMAHFDGGQSALPLVVYGNDNTTGVIDGMIKDEPMNIRIFRNGQTIDATAVYSNQTENNNGLFAENGLSIISDLKLGSTGMDELTNRLSIYPNPSNGMITIQVDGQYELVVTNVQGQQVFSASIESNASLDLSDQPAGIYFVRLTNNTQTLIERILIR